MKPDYLKKIKKGLETVLKISETAKELERSPFKKGHFVRINRISRSQIKNLERFIEQKK